MGFGSLLRGSGGASRGVRPGKNSPEEELNLERTCSLVGVENSPKPVAEAGMDPTFERGGGAI